MATSARLDELKKKFDENPRRYFAPLANEYRKQGDLTQAIALCRAHLPNQPGHISGHIVLAQALYEARELGEARSIFEAALDLDPENLIALRFLGDIAREQGEPAQARGWYQRVLEADPRNDEIAHLLTELDRASASSYAPPLAAVAVEEFEAAPPAPPASLSNEASLIDLAIDLPTESLVPPVLDHAIDTGIDEPHHATGHDEIERPPVSLAAGTSGATAAVEDDPFFGGSPDASSLAMGEFEAVAEPSIDDWFGASAEHSEPETTVGAETDEAPVAFDDSFFPDLASATPVTSVAVPEQVAQPAAFPDEVDVQAPTPPFVRAEEDRLSAIPTPPFLLSVDLEESPSGVPAGVEPQGATEPVVADDTPTEPTPSFDWHFAPTPVDTPSVASWDAVADALPPVAAGAAEPDVAGEIAPVGEVERGLEAPADEAVRVEAAAVDAEVAESLGGWGDLEESSVRPAALGGVTTSFESVDSSSVAEGAASELDEWTLEPETNASTPEAVVAESSPETEIEAAASGPVAEFETEDSIAAYAREVASTATPDGFVLEETEFVPPAHEETPFIASSLSAAFDEPDAYTAGAPELSAHEPFPIEAERVDDMIVAESPEAASRAMVSEPGVSLVEAVPAFDDEAPLDAVVSIGVEAPAEAVALVEGLVPHETPADADAIVAEADASFDVAPSVESAQGVAGGAAAGGAAAGEATAFVTETMAELYLQQGFREEALAIYRQLLAQQPDDHALRDRVSALEHGSGSPVIERIVPRDAVDRAGQSVRSFFLHFARREPRQRGSRPGGGDDRESSEPHRAALDGAERPPSYSGVATREEALTVPDAPSSPAATEPATSLSDLFEAGPVSRADDRAASTLASAFGRGEPSGDGASGGASERELSLEHLFRDVPARSSSAVTLDEFDAGPSPRASDPTSPHGEAGEERDADIEQFTAWLEGLKKK